MKHTNPPLAWALLLLCAALAGCPPPRTVALNPPAAVDRVDRIVVQTLPAAVNWDDRPGPDGVEVRVHLFRYDRELPVCGKGTLEFVLFEGLVRPGQTDKAKPFRTWQFDEKLLKEHLARSAYGWGYIMRLPWGAAAPSTSSVTLLTRYLPTKGPPVHEHPISIATRPR